MTPLTESTHHTYGEELESYHNKSKRVMCERQEVDQYDPMARHVVRNTDKVMVIILFCVENEIRNKYLIRRQRKHLDQNEPRAAINLHKKVNEMYFEISK